MTLLPRPASRRRSTLVGVALAGVLGACVQPGALDERSSVGLRPSFAPADEAPDGSVGVPAAPPATSAPVAPPPTVEPTSAPAPTNGPASPEALGDPTLRPSPRGGLTAAITDPRGDVVPGRPAAPPPAYADLRGATLSHDGTTFTLRLELEGGAPAASGSDQHTMNVAAFYDLDGDGTIDRETWANLSPTGWGTSQFDNDGPSARYGADDDVTVEVQDGTLVLTFPTSLLDDAPRFRWALAAEWGTYEDLQLGTMSRDLAPDDQRPAGFPG